MPSLAAVTLGLHGRRLAPTEGRYGEAVTAIVIGACAVVIGAVMWSFIT